MNAKHWGFYLAFKILALALAAVFVTGWIGNATPQTIISHGVIAVSLNTIGAVFVVALTIFAALLDYYCTWLLLDWHRPKEWYGGSNFFLPLCAIGPLLGLLVTVIMGRIQTYEHLWLYLIIVSCSLPTMIIPTIILLRSPEPPKFPS